MYNTPLMDIEELTQAMDKFVTDKGWYQPQSLRPQTLKNLAISLNIEAAEVLELFQWTDQAPDSKVLSAELADVTLYLLQIAKIAGINLEEAVRNKLTINYNRKWDQIKENKRKSHDHES